MFQLYAFISSSSEEDRGERKVQNNKLQSPSAFENYYCNALKAQMRQARKELSFAMHVRTYINKLQVNSLLYNTTRTITEGATFMTTHWPLRYFSGRKTNIKLK